MKLLCLSLVACCLLSQTPDSYSGPLEQIRQGDARGAVAELRSLLAREPGRAKAHNALGVALEATGDKEGAVRAFQSALDLQPNFHQAAHNLAKLYGAQGRHTAAIELLQRTLGEKPPAEVVSHLQLLLAEEYEQTKDYGRAVEILRRMPDAPDIPFRLGRAYAGREMYEEAGAHFSEALRRKPVDQAVRLSLVRSLVALRRYEEAASQIDESARRDFDGAYLLGLAYRGLEQWPAAAAAFATAVKLKPEHPESRLHYGLALLRGGKSDAALEQLEAARRLQPNSAETRHALAQLYRAKRQEHRAQEEFDELKRLRDRSARADQSRMRLVYANQLFAAGNAREAAVALREAVELDPANARVRYNLSLALGRLEDRAGQERELEKAVELDSNLAIAYNGLGALHLEQGRTAEAEGAFRKAVAADPQYAEAKNSLGVLYAMLGRSVEAAALFRQATEDDPNYAQAHANWGLVLATEGRREEARRHLETAVRLAPQLAEARAGLELLRRASTPEVKR